MFQFGNLSGPDGGQQRPAVGQRPAGVLLQPGLQTEPQRLQLLEKQVGVVAAAFQRRHPLQNAAPLVSRVIKVAKTFLDEGKKLSFAVADKAKFGAVLDEFGLNAESDVPLVTIRTAKGEKYAMSEKFS